MPRFSFPATGVELDGRATLFAIDDASLPLYQNLAYFLSKPTVREAPVLAPRRDDPSAPDHLATHFYGSVLHDGEKFRMWYYACHAGLNPDWPHEKRIQYPANIPAIIMGPVCYAESDDGIEWRRPALHQVRFKGSTDNNIIDLPNPVTAGVFVVRDDADPDPARRYKMVYSYYTHEPGVEFYESAGAVRSAWSADGIRWTAGPRPMVHCFLEPGSLIQHQGLFTIHGQKAGGGMSESGGARGRQGYCHVSPDFTHWLESHAEGFALPDPRDTGKRELSGLYDQVHLGVGATSLGTACIGVYGLWHNADFLKNFAEISCDFGLVVSNDGLRFREVVKNHLFLPRDASPVTPLPGKRYNTILAQANGILNVGDETRLYHGRWRNVEYRGGERDARDYYAEVALATLPRDRWGALALVDSQKTGEAWTGVFQPSRGKWHITLNADEAHAMRVEVADERFALLPAFSGENAGRPTQAAGLDCAVPFANDLSKLAGQRLRLRVTLTRAGDKRPALYAIDLAAGAKPRRGR